MTRTISGAAAALALVVSFSCSRFPAPKNLDTESGEFYSKIRYIITREERESFLRLSPVDRRQFMKEFWERRDPTPGTELNEFKKDYFRRIEEANRLFREGSTPGWLQDRGKIYITLGPPDSRETYPRGIDFYGKPEEIWRYGFFPVVFIDENWSGNYRLTPLSAQHIAEITLAQAVEKERRDGRQFEAAPSLDFEITVEKADGKTVFAIKIPYKAIWFKAEGDTFNTTLEVSLTVNDRDGATVWETTKNFDISVPRAEGLKLFEQTYEMRIEAEMAAGAYKLNAVVSNRTGGSQSKKSLDIEV